MVASDDPGPFRGFPEAALDFYEGLEADNSKAYWTDHREMYEQAIAAPMRALLAALAPTFGETKFFRPYRDVRFSHDKTPYKTHAGAVVRRDGPNGRDVRYVELSADGLLVAGGYWYTSTAQARRLRGAIADPRRGPSFSRMVSSLREQDFEIGGDQLKRIPKPWDERHPRAEWLRHKSLTASRRDLPAPSLHDAAVLERVRSGWQAVTPLLRWLDRHVGADPAA